MPANPRDLPTYVKDYTRALLSFATDSRNYHVRIQTFI